MRTTIESGTTVSHYRVLSPLGAGGMGEVYKAHDNTLERTVALKILPPDLVKNDERVRRFVQEAKSASSLNHPHIVTIHEIGEARLSVNGDDSAGPLHYIAMELIDGVTLKKKIHDGDTDLRTLLSYIAQAADGLAKAHAAGIVHRDLKPENIMVSRDGFAKVLDFGLAKLNVKKATSEGQTQATAIRDETREGALLGTVAYMSPEQVQGKPVDHRTDVFALGAILYEAATRRRPFEADSDVDVMHKILHDKPQPIDEIQPDVPTELRRMIRRCLAKEPEKRFQSMKDIALELSEIVDEFDQLSTSSSTRGSTSTSTSGSFAAPPPSRVWGIVAAVGVVALVAMGLAFFQWRKAQSNIEPVSYASMRIQRLTSSQDVASATVSPDGKYVAYARVDNGGLISLWIRQIATGSDVQIVAPSRTRISGIAFNPSGDYLYYGQTEAAEGPGYAWLYSVPALGGTPRKLIFDVDTPVAFSPDGKQMAFGRGIPPKNQNALVVANSDGTGERTVATLMRFEDPSRPSWTRDGKKIVVPVTDVSQGWTAFPMEVDVATGARRRIGNVRWFGLRSPVFDPDGRSLLFAGVDTQTARSQVWLQGYPDGQPVRVTNDLNAYDDVSLTADGSSIVAVQIQRQTTLRIADDAQEADGKLFASTGDQIIDDVAVSAAGTVAYAFITGNTAEIAVIDAPGAAPRVLTREGENFNPSITADGKTIVYQSERGTELPHVYAMDVDGSHSRQLTRGDGEVRPDVSPDGRFILYMAQKDLSLWIANADGGQPRRLSAAINSNATFSSDGKYVAFAEWRTRDGRAVNNLVVVPAAGGAPVLDMPFVGRSLRWHPKENGVTYRFSTGGGDNIFLQPLDGSAPRQLTHLRDTRFFSYDWTAGGKAIFARADTRSDAVMITDWRKKE